MGNAFKKKPQQILRVILMGLPSSGKTVLLYKLRLDEMVTTIPTFDINREQIEYDGIKFDLIELPHRFTFHNGELDLIHSL